MADGAFNSQEHGRLVSAVDRHVGRQIRKLRSAVGLTLEQAADTVGVPVATFTAWEGGKLRIPPHHLLTLSRVLACPLSNFFDGLQPALYSAGEPELLENDVATLIKQYPAAKH